MIRCKAFCIVLVFWMVTGCASVNPKPFDDFANSVTTVQDGMAKALTLSESNARETLIENLASDSNAKFGDVQILSGANYQWHYSSNNPPVYLALIEAQAKLAHLSEVFADYAELLANLAGGKILDPAAFDTMAADLNSKATKLSHRYEPGQSHRWRSDFFCCGYGPL